MWIACSFLAVIKKISVDILAHAFWTWTLTSVCLLTYWGVWLRSYWVCLALTGTGKHFFFKVVIHQFTFPPASKSLHVILHAWQHFELSFFDCSHFGGVCSFRTQFNISLGWLKISSPYFMFIDYFFKKNDCIYLRKREGAWVVEGKAGSPLSAEPDVGLDPRILISWPELKSLTATRAPLFLNTFIFFLMCLFFELF